MYNIVWEPLGSNKGRHKKGTVWTRKPFFMVAVQSMEKWRILKTAYLPAGFTPFCCKI